MSSSVDICNGNSENDEKMSENCISQMSENEEDLSESKDTKIHGNALATPGVIGKKLPDH